MLCGQATHLRGVISVGSEPGSPSDVTALLARSRWMHRVADTGWFRLPLLLDDHRQIERTELVAGTELLAGGGERR